MFGVKTTTFFSQNFLRWDDTTSDRNKKALIFA
jgi:hypothetical protein